MNPGPEQAAVIDRPSRDALAQLIRQWAAGTITTGFALQEAQRIERETNDHAAGYLAEDFVLMFEDWPDRARGSDRLPAEARRQIARTVVFLHSDHPLQWPNYAINLLTPLGWFLKIVAVSLSVLGWALSGWLLGVLSTVLLVWHIGRRILRQCFSDFHESLAAAAKAPPEPSAWPFYNDAELQAALESPRLLAAGSRRPTPRLP